MNNQSIKKKGISISLLLAMVILVSTIVLSTPKADATSKYIKVDAFIKQLVKSMELKVDITTDNPYIDAALSAGILKENDFTSYTKYITRTDAAVLLNRADEYLHGDIVKEKLLNFVLKKRISDIKKIAKSKRTAVAKVYAKGIIKGYGNGYYVQNREFRGSGYLTTATAKNFINLTINTKKRAKISQDGQLIRTTNLPKNASKYEYILECFPNKFYEKKFEFMLTNQYIAGERHPEYEGYPVQMKKWTFKTWYDERPLSDEMDKYLYDWTSKAEKYLRYVFNVDYKTVDSKWINGLGSMYAESNLDMPDMISTYYIKNMKANKVIVDNSIISVEPSTLYYDNGYCLRAYVRYRIIAKDINVDQGKLIYAQYPYLKNLKSGIWRDGIFDIRFSTNDGFNGDGSDWAISLLTNISD